MCECSESNQQYSTVRYGTARHGTARHGTARHGTARHGTARHGTARHGTAQHSTAQHSTERNGTIQCNAVQYSYTNTVRYGKVRYSTVQCITPAKCVVVVHFAAFAEDFNNFGVEMNALTAHPRERRHVKVMQQQRHNFASNLKRQITHTQKWMNNYEQIRHLMKPL